MLKRPDALKRRPDSGGEPVLHPAHPSNRLPGESLFNRLSRLSLFDAVSAEEVGSLMQRVFGLCPLSAVRSGNRSIDLVRAAQEKLVKRLGGQDVHDLDDLTSANFLPQEQVANSFIPYSAPLESHVLHYCPACLRLGFHSMLYQHAAMTHCPCHGTRLLNVCVDCGRGWRPTVEKTITDPFACSACGRLYWKSVPPNGAADELRQISAAVLGCWDDLRLYERICNERVLAPRLGSSPGPQVRTAKVVRRVQRATAWPKALPSPWQRFKESRGELPRGFWPREETSKNVSLAVVGEEASETLRWLTQQCEAPLAESVHLVEGSWRHIQYISPVHQDRKIGAVTAALHLTMSRYGWRRESYVRCSPGQEGPYDAVTWNGFRSDSTPLCFGPLSGQLVATEILGYFALSLLRCAGLSPLDGPAGEPGTAAFEPADFCPSWILQRGNDTGWVLRYRKRVTRELVTWLLRRYRGRPLQRLVTCSWSKRPVFEVRFSPVEFPPELLQFPQANPTFASTQPRPPPRT